MATYELTFIVRPDTDDNGLTAVTDKITAQVQTAGGSVLNRKTIGKRRLAYQIRKFLEGTYILFELDLPTTAVPTIERQLTLNESLLRHLVVRIEAPVLQPAPEATAAPAQAAAPAPAAAAAAAAPAQAAAPAPAQTPAAAPAPAEETTPPPSAPTGS